MEQNTSKFNKKNRTHVRKVGHTSEFPFGIYWWTLENPKIRLLKKWKNLLEISFCICVQKPTIIGDTIPEIWSETIFFCYFGSFLALLTPSPLTTQKTKFLKMKKDIWRCHHFKLVLQKTRSYDVCLLRYGVLAQT